MSGGERRCLEAVEIDARGQRRTVVVGGVPRNVVVTGLQNAFRKRRNLLADHVIDRQADVARFGQSEGDFGCRVERIRVVGIERILRRNRRFYALRLARRTRCVTTARETYLALIKSLVDGTEGALHLVHTHQRACRRFTGDDAVGELQETSTGLWQPEGRESA